MLQLSSNIYLCCLKEKCVKELIVKGFYMIHYSIALGTLLLLPHDFLWHPPPKLSPSSLLSYLSNFICIKHSEKSRTLLDSFLLGWTDSVYCCYVFVWIPYRCNLCWYSCSFVTYMTCNPLLTCMGFLHNSLTMTKHI